MIYLSKFATYLPSNIVTSDDIDRLLATHSPEFEYRPGLIERVSGIKTRRWAGPEEHSSTLAIQAARTLFDSLPKNLQIDTLIYAAATKDVGEPATAHIVNDGLKLAAVRSVFDVQNACNSFLDGIEIAVSLIEARRAQQVLVVSGEKPSVLCKTRVRTREEFKQVFAGYTFGDAGAAVLVSTEKRLGQYEYLGSGNRVESSHWTAGMVRGGGTRFRGREEDNYFQGGGAEIAKVFTSFAPEAVDRILEERKWSLSAFDTVCLHQVSLAYTREFMQCLGIPPKKCRLTIEEYGNVASGSIPLGLRVIPEAGQQVLLIGLAGGSALRLTGLKVL